MKKIFKNLRDIGIAAVLSMSFANLTSAQFGCGSGVVITDGYTASGITTPGNGGPEAWVTSSTGAGATGNYWGDDTYMFQYTAGATAEEISMTIFTRNNYNGIGIFTTCTGTDISVFLDDAASGFSSNVPQTVTAVITAGQTVYIALGQWGTPNDLDFDVTNFSVTPISCPDPTALSISNLTSTSADLAWTEAGTATSWNIEYGAPGFTLGNGTPGIGVGNPHAVAGLTADTDYEFYVQADCGSGDLSGWSGPYSFFTGLCVPSPGSVDGIGITNITMGTINNTTGAETNNYGDYTAQSTVAQAGTSLPINITLETGYTYNLFAWVDWNGDLDYDDAGEGYYLGQSSNANPTTFSSSILIPAGATLGNYRIRIGGADNGLGSSLPSNPCYTSGYATFEDYTLNVTAPPACIAPSALTSSNLTSTSADLAWTVNGTETVWNIEYGPAGFTPGSGTGFIETGVSTNPFTLNGLTPSTVYDFYIQADCGSIQSTLSASASFTTECVAFYNAPFYEGFNSAALPLCWESLSSNTSTSADNYWKFNGQADYGASSNGRNPGEFAWTDGSGTTPDSMILLSPMIDLTPLTDPELSFDWFSNNTNNPGDNNPFIIDIYDGLVWTNLDTLVGDSSAWLSVYYDLAAYAGNTVQFRFMVNQNVITTDAYYNDILLDEFKVDELTTCFDPSALAVANITPFTADLSWFENGTATTWNIEYGAPGFMIGSGTPENGVTTNPYTLSGLTADTDYEFYIQADCGPGDLSGWAGPFSFSTPPTCLAPSALTVNNITLTSADLGWTENGTSALWNIEYGAPGFMLGSGTSENGVTNNPFTLSGLTAETDYEFYVQSDCGGGDESDWAGPFSFYTGYCIPSASGTATFVDDFSTTNGSTNISNLTSGISPAGYFDGTAQVVTSYETSSFDFSASIVGGTAGFAIWIDFNNDLVFDNATEKVFNTTSYGNGPFTGTVSIPAGTPLGDYRMRITTDWLSNNPSAPCADRSRAEFEDYTLSVVAPPPCTDPSTLTASNFTPTSVDLSWTENGTATVWNIEYGPAGFTQGTGTVLANIANPYTVPALMPCTDYEYYVQADCGVNSSAMVGPFAFTTQDTPATGTDTQVACETFTWIDGNTYTSSNNTATYTYVGGGSSTCGNDSIVTLDLTINNSTMGTDVQAACETFDWIDGNTYTASNNTATFTIVGGNANGCDSIVTLDLTIDTPPNAGDDVMRIFCMNQPLDLDTLLSANADAGGTWVDPSGNAITGTMITLSGTPDVYIYTYVTAANGACPAETASIEITVDGGCDYLSITDEAMVDISVYPNPTTSVLTILNPSNTSSLKVEMLDMNGRIVLVENTALNNATEATLAIDYLERGIYTLRVYNNEGQKTFKIVKQ
jgi:hypothetical protein